MQVNKMDTMEARYQSLEDQLSDPAVISNQSKWRALSKEHADLGEIVNLYKSYKEADAACKEALSVLEDKSQEELHELAKEDLKENEQKKIELDNAIHRLLIPKDPNDGKNVILEIRAGRRRSGPFRIRLIKNVFEVCRKKRMESRNNRCK